MKDILHYVGIIENEIGNTYPVSQDHDLFAPIGYILNLGGKRIRPALCLMASDLYGGDLSDALPSALAVELFHNFSLIHDDIMDKAPLRRGKATVHKKWNVEMGILSGDAMLVLAYQLLEKLKDRHLKPILHLFNQTSLEVCIGQQFDMEFENKDEVHIDEYIEMIRLKTSVLIGASFKMGAICSDQKEEEAQKIYDFGEKLGIAFQLRDDYLDAFSKDGTSGKQLGGDILANKKTFLPIMAMEIGSKEDQEKMRELLASNTAYKVERTLEIYKRLGVDELLNKEIKKYSDDAIDALHQTSLNDHAKKQLEDFANQLMTRTT